MPNPGMSSPDGAARWPVAPARGELMQRNLDSENKDSAGTEVGEFKVDPSRVGFSVGRRF